VKPPSFPRPRVASAPPTDPCVRRLAIPEINALRELRRALARGGIPPLDKRTPEDSARIGAFQTIGALLRLLDEYKRRVEDGQRCRLVEVERSPQPGRILIEIAIEAQP